MRAGEALVLLTMRVVGWQAARSARRDRTDRGDVPGWVLVTLMSAILVSGLVVVAGDELERVLRDALNTVVP
jgi:hypothetical protein